MAEDESACAIAEEAAKFTGNTARGERPAVDVGGDDSNRPSLPRAKEGLSEHHGIEQSKASAADIQGAAIFPGEQAGMKLRGKRRIVVVRFAGGDDPVELLGPAGGGLQRFLRRLRAERHFILVFGGV